jgi:hypothetical protein
MLRRRRARSQTRELAVQNPTEFELVINIRSPRLGLIVPPSLLTTAYEVIE